MSAEAIHIAVVGHTNAGKTSLLRTLTRQAHFGEVSDRPGTTRHVEAIGLQVDGVTRVRYFDTPGLEDSVALQHHLKQMSDALTPPQRVRALLGGPEAHGVFEQEAKVLRQLLQADAAIVVIDCREPVLPKYRSEIELLTGCARPIMPVLNFVRAEGAREPEWRELLAAYGLHAAVRFDAVAPFVGSERQLYEDLGVLLRNHRPTLQAVLAELDQQAQARRTASARHVADMLISAAAMRREAPGDTLAEHKTRDAFVGAFRAELVKNLQQGVNDLLALHGFAKDDAQLDVMSWASGRWASDLFNPETLASVGRLLGQGAAAGAAVGLTLDIALAGLSLGTGTALGAAIGGVVGQGWGQLPRKLRNRLMRIEELTLQDDVLAVLADGLLQLCQRLEARGHAALEPLAVRLAPADSYRADLKALLADLAPARSHPEWEPARGSANDTDNRREVLRQLVAHRIERLLD
ncbi:GTPase/DUF3482 domain-containing protein [Hydrogenophaga sp.]|uniref:GTPase/DUF3482 domain-containing protein n=1 Tax=Hydrogenophaga sp. TaxID=1904254 RepID=UPI00271B28D8|nr:GTPase/DUF3482 domain-containing protein [Hydrogenophaga sp.]MDO8904242.1 GTPase/DUF3482 domain-containing protein [Hydrogenophaga sp.]